jgi:hypothetical protein
MTTHHDSMETHTLRICNQPSGLLTANTNGFFSLEIPGHLRDRDCFVHVVSGSVGNLDAIFEAAEDPNVAIIRHNIVTNSYDSTTKGTNRSFGTAIRPGNNEKIAQLNEAQSLDLGRCKLPPLLEVETVGFIAATGAEVRLDKAKGFVEIILMLEFPNEQ